MASDEPRTATCVDSGHWIDASTRAALELIAEGVTELAGFDVAAISVLDHDELEIVAVAGHRDAQAALEGSRSTVRLTCELIDVADDWGPLRFVPHHRAADYLARYGWVPDYESLDVDGAWHPKDMLFAPFFDDAGALQGLLAVDLPRDGMRPVPTARRQLEKYAAQAGRAVLAAHERAQLLEQVQIAARARLAVREASRELSLDRLLEACQTELVAGFGARGLWIHIPEHHGSPMRDVVHSTTPLDVTDLPQPLIETAELAARLAWRAQRVDIISEHRVQGSELSPEELQVVVDFGTSVGVTSMLIVPLGEGQVCLGVMVLSRDETVPDWSDAEVSVALDIGHDLGHAIAHARAFEREQALVCELQVLDSYKDELIATLSHELKTPLASILGNLQLLDAMEELSVDGRRGLAAIERGTDRLVRVVDDLMLLAKIGGTGNPLLARPIDIACLIEEALGLVAPTVQQRSIELVFLRGGGLHQVSGDAGELDRMLTNILSNAVKYTQPGGRIEVGVYASGDSIVITCADNGIGISENDQEQLFREFFRSTNPSALKQPGTGLGLSIVERIVTRHGGQIAVRSGLGEGSTFQITLPVAAEEMAEPSVEGPIEIGGRLA